MAKSFSEIGKKAEDLMEQGKEADRNVVSCQAMVISANSRVAAARRQLAAAMETDEEGRPRGNVAMARAQLSMAEHQLTASQNALSGAQARASQVRQQKNSHVQDIGQHNRISRSNLEKLSLLLKGPFGADSAALAEGIAKRHNEAEDIRVDLLHSLGIEETPDYVSVESGSAGPEWKGGGFAPLDLSGQAQSYRGGGRSTQDARSFFGKLLGQDNAKQVNSTNVINFSGLLLENNGMSTQYFVKGNNYEEFCRVFKNLDDYTRIPIENKIITVNARDIEGIYLNEDEAKDSWLFWNRGKEYPIDSETYFMEIASLIPEIRARLAAGESVESIQNDPRLERCYNAFFASPIEVYEMGDFYCFAGAGRHRCMAAQKLGYEIPVKVIGKYEQKSVVQEKTQNDMHLSVDTYPKIFTGTEAEYKNTKTFVDYVNSIGNSDKRVLNLYNNIGRIANLENKGIQFKLSHGRNNALDQKGERINGKVRTREMILTVPQLSGDNITGQVQTTLHELMHLIDQGLKSDVGDMHSPGFAAANIRMRDALYSSTSDFCPEVKAVFDDYAKQLREVGTSLRSRYDSVVNDAREKLNVDGDFDSYLKKVNKAKEALEVSYDYHARNLMQGGVGQLQDIYDALSGGTLFDSGVVRFGHGSEYYRTCESRIDEIIANYASLSVTRPDFIRLLKTDKPELTAALDNIIDLMNERVTNYE